MNLHDALIPPTAIIVDAIRCIDRGGYQIALVVDEQQTLLGTITDGDIRRALLRGLPLSAEVSGIMNCNPYTISQDTPKTEQLRIMRVRGIHQLPLVDAQGHVTGLSRIDDLLSSGQRPNPVVLMAGGLGTRLRPLTEKMPKPMLAVGGKPLLETILESFVNHGFHRFFISLNYRGEIIKDYFGDGHRWGVEIDYLEEESSMGTAGSLTLLPERLSHPFFVMNGDILTSVNFLQMLKFHLDTEAEATMAIYEHALQVDYGVVQVDDYRLTRIIEKPLHRFFINAGIYMLNPETLERIPRGQRFDMPMLFQSLVDDGGRTAAFPIRESWIDIGQPNDLLRAEAEFLKLFG